MSKKVRVFFIMLSTMSLFIAFIVYSILSIFVDNSLINEYSFITVYEKDYYLKIKFWWIYLTFLPLSIVSLIYGLRHRDKVLNSVSSILMLVMITISFINFNDTKHYSTSKEYLTLIENSIKYDFHEETTILVNKSVSVSNSSGIICEGIIRIPQNKENIIDLENKIMWTNKIDNNLDNIFSKKFKFYFDYSDKFTYVIEDNNVLTFLAYYSEKAILFFTIIEI